MTTHFANYQDLVSEFKYCSTLNEANEFFSAEARQQLPDLIDSPEKLVSFFSMVRGFYSEKFMTELIQTLDTRITQFANTAKTMTQLLTLDYETDHGDCINLFYGRFKDHLSTVIQNANDFVMVAKSIPNKNASADFVTMMWQRLIKDLIVDSKSFFEINHLLNKHEKKALISEIWERIPTFIHTTDDLINVLSSLPTGKQSALFNSLDSKLQRSLIMDISREDFERLFTAANDSLLQHTLLSLLGDHLNKYIDNAHSYVLLYRRLSDSNKSNLDVNKIFDNMDLSKFTHIFNLTSSRPINFKIEYVKDFIINFYHV